MNLKLSQQMNPPAYSPSSKEFLHSEKEVKKISYEQGYKNGNS